MRIATTDSEGTYRFTDVVPGNYKITVSAPNLQNLPAISSEGKNVQALYKLVPSATMPTENNSAAGNPQRAMTSNVNGQSSQGNNTSIDGVLNAYPWLPNNVAYVPPTDAIETVNVVTSSFDAEQGRATTNTSLGGSGGEREFLFGGKLVI